MIGRGSSLKSTTAKHLTRAVPYRKSEIEIRDLRFRPGPRPNQADLQPPFPLQEFFPLQPLSPALQPPWPLQEFRPLQEWEAGVVLELIPAELGLLLHPTSVVAAPATNPVRAAAATTVVIDLRDIVCSFI